MIMNDQQVWNWKEVVRHVYRYYPDIYLAADTKPTKPQ
jgi:hypothetical protein